MRREKDPKVGTRKPGPKPKALDHPRTTAQRKMATATHCANGHPWVERTTYVDPRGRKVCKICRMRSQRKHLTGTDDGFKDIGTWNRDKTHCPRGHAYAEHGRNNPNGTRSCRICQSIGAKLRAYGLTEDELDALMDRAEGCCEICLQEAELHVDHDHATGAVRGLLCTNCNNGLGRFRDKPDLLRSAADYLERYA